MTPALSLTTARRFTRYRKHTASDLARRLIESEDEVARLQALYENAVQGGTQAVAECDKLIAHLRERYNWLKAKIEVLPVVGTHRSCGCKHCEALQAACEEPTP